MFSRDRKPRAFAGGVSTSDRNSSNAARARSLGFSKRTRPSSDLPITCAVWVLMRSAWEICSGAGSVRSNRYPRTTTNRRTQYLKDKIRPSSGARSEKILQRHVDTCLPRTFGMLRTRKTARYPAFAFHESAPPHDLVGLRLKRRIFCVQRRGAVIEIKAPPTGVGKCLLEIGNHGAGG